MVSLLIIPFKMSRFLPLFLSFFFQLSIPFYPLTCYGQVNNYQQAVEKIIRYDTDLTSSDISSIHYSIMESDTLITETYPSLTSSAVSIDSAVDVGNSLSIYPIYVYLCLRKYLRGSKTENIQLNDSIRLHNNEILNLENLVFQSSKLPKNPEIPARFSDEFDLYRLNTQQLRELVKAQSLSEYCSVSGMNTLMAIHLLEQKRIEIDSSVQFPALMREKVFAKAKKGNLSFNSLVTIIQALIDELPSVEARKCTTRVKNYTMLSGFYYTKVKNRYALYTMTGRTEIGYVYIGLIPSTKTAVVLLSEGKDVEIIDLGFLILRMINYNWKK